MGIYRNNKILFSKGYSFSVNDRGGGNSPPGLNPVIIKEKYMIHKVQINVAEANGKNQRVLSSRFKRISNRFLHFLFGDYSQVLILKPGKSIQAIEIKEIEGELLNAN